MSLQSTFGIRSWCRVCEHVAPGVLCDGYYQVIMPENLPTGTHMGMRQWAHWEGGLVDRGADLLCSCKDAY
jgi:hypothetical protein